MQERLCIVTIQEHDVRTSSYGSVLEESESDVPGWYNTLSRPQDEEEQVNNRNQHGMISTIWEFVDILLKLDLGVSELFIKIFISSRE